MKSKNNLKGAIVVLVLLLAIGFAAVTTTLFINGTVNIGPNASHFQDNVIFYEKNVSGSADSNVTGDADASAQISADGKSITFTTQILDVIGETAVLDYQIQNNSSYDATLGDLKCSWGEEFNENSNSATLTDENGYISVVASNERSGDVVGANGYVSGWDTVTVTLLKSWVGDNNSQVSEPIKFTCQIDVTAGNE